VFGVPALVFRRYVKLSVPKEELDKGRAEYERKKKVKK